MLADVLGEEPQHEVAVLLQQQVLATVATVGVRIGQMLAPSSFDGHTRIGAQQIHFHLSPAVEGNRQLGIQAEPTRSSGKRLQPAVEKRLGRTPRTLGAFGIGRQSARAAWTNRFASGASTPSRTSRRTLAA